jgi:LacI family transcriptional regulator
MRINNIVFTHDFSCVNGCVTPILLFFDMSNFLQKIPHVLVALPTEVKANHDKLQGILRYAKLNGPWDVQFMGLHPVYPQLGELENWQPDGVIQDVNVKEAVAWRKRKRIPVVQMDGPPPQTRSVSWVNHDSRTIAETVAAFFLQRKFRYFAYVDTVPQAAWSRERLEAFTNRLRTAGYGCAVYTPPSPTESDDWGLEQPRLRAWLEALPKPCGLMVAMDLRAKQVLDTCLAATIRVPEEIAVIGVDNDETICENTRPSLSSVLPDFEGGGYLAAELLDSLMREGSRKAVRFTYGVKRIVHRLSSLDIRVSSPLAATALEFIRLNACAGITVTDVARRLNVSRRFAEIHFREARGHSILEEIQRQRLDRVRALLRETDLPIGEIGARCGYGTETYLKALFKTRFGTTMRDYRKSPRSAESPRRSDRPTPAENIVLKRGASPTHYEAQVCTKSVPVLKAQVDRIILGVCQNGSRSSSEIATALGHKTLSGNLRKALPRLKAAGLLAYTDPAHPRSRFQKYRLTPVGYAALREQTD